MSFSFEKHRDREDVFSDLKTQPEHNIFMQLIELTESEWTGENAEVVALLLSDKTFVIWMCKMRGPSVGAVHGRNAVYGERTRN